MELRLTGAQLTTVGRQYRARVNSDCGHTVLSDPVTFTYQTLPNNTSQPFSQTSCSNHQNGLQYPVSGSPFSYGWEYNDGQGWIPIGTNASSYPGYNTAMVTMNGDEPNGRQYRVSINSDCERLYFGPATFTTAVPLAITS